MTKLGKSMLGLWAIGMGIAMSAPALAVNAVGPYYATPSWDQTLPAATRFIVLTNMGGAAVLDRETGLVWEQSPSTDPEYWFTARSYCISTSVGNRKGWRLPSVQELASLVDSLQAVSGSALPSGHPFSNVGGQYWSITVFNNPLDSPYTNAWTVDFNNGGIDNINTAVTFPKPIPGTNNAKKVWCVRGGQGPDLQ